MWIFLKRQSVSVANATPCCACADERYDAVEFSSELAAQQAALAQKEEQVHACTLQLTEASQAASDSATSAQK